MSDKCEKCGATQIWATSAGQYLCLSCNADRSNGVGGIDVNTKVQWISKVPGVPMNINPVESFKGKVDVCLSVELPDGNIVYFKTETVTWEEHVCLVSSEMLEQLIARYEALAVKCRELRDHLELNLVATPMDESIHGVLSALDVLTRCESQGPSVPRRVYLRSGGPFTAYGCCPMCGAAGTQRERRPNGNDTCANGHTYPSDKAITKGKA